MSEAISNLQAAQEKASSWFYQKSKGGGSLQDYLGYGTTLGTWFMGGRAPVECGPAHPLPPPPPCSG